MKEKIAVDSPNKKKMQLRPNTKKNVLSLPRPTKQIQGNNELQIEIVSPNNRAAQRNNDLRVDRPNELRNKLGKIEDVIHGKEDEIEMKQSMPKLEEDPDMNTNKEDKEDKDDKDKEKRNDGAGKLDLYAGNFRGNKIIGLYDKY